MIVDIEEKIRTLGNAALWVGVPLGVVILGMSLFCILGGVVAALLAAGAALTAYGADADLFKLAALFLGVGTIGAFLSNHMIQRCKDKLLDE